MHKKILSLLLLSLTMFSQLMFAGKADAQAGNPRDFAERFVIRAIQTIHGAQMTYQATSGAGNYGSFDDLLQAGFIDSALASGDKYGYTFALFVTNGSSTTPARFYVTATPRSYPKTGHRSYFIDERGEMRGADKGGAAATAADPTIDTCLIFYGNERCAILSMRTLHGAQMTYQATTGNGSFGNLNQLYGAGLIRQSLASGQSHGYNFDCITIERTATTPAFFKIVAVPVNYGVTGFRSFYIDDSGVIRGADKQGQPADENDPPIED